MACVLSGVVVVLLKWLSSSEADAVLSIATETPGGQIDLTENSNGTLRRFVGVDENTSLSSNRGVYTSKSRWKGSPNAAPGG